MNLGSAVKVCRSQQGLSQKELAFRAGCSISYLSMIERGDRDPTVSTVEKISKGLGVPMGVLFLLASEKEDISGMDRALAGQLAIAALEFISERRG